MLIEEWHVTLTYDGSGLDMALTDGWEDGLAALEATVAFSPATGSVDLYLHLEASSLVDAVRAACERAFEVTGRMPLAAGAASRSWLLTRWAEGDDPEIHP